MGIVFKVLRALFGLALFIYSIPSIISDGRWWQQFFKENTVMGDINNISLLQWGALAIGVVLLLSVIPISRWKYIRNKLLGQGQPKAAKRIGLDLQGGSFSGRNVKISDQDTAIQGDQSDFDIDQLEVK